jgi:PhnB protein
MAVKAVPEGFHTVTPQLAIEGAGKAMDFYVKALGAVEIARVPDPSGHKVWHGVLRFGSSMFFINDVFKEMAADADQHSSSFWLYVDDVDAAFKRAVEAGCKAMMPPMDMFWGDRMAHVSDPFGQTWALATHTRDLTPEQQKAEMDKFLAASKGGHG